jgi:hypothetical protein
MSDEELLVYAQSLLDRVIRDRPEPDTPGIAEGEQEPE